MKIGFFGTPDIASYCLEKLHESHEIIFVVTNEDKKTGRNQKIIFSPVKKTALDLNIKILQPGNLNDESFIDEIKKSNSDIFIVVAYGKIIPEKVFTIPDYNTINLHPSLLPKYRGAAPVQWALINGEKETGITVQEINKKMDAGDIIIQKPIPLTPDMGSTELFEVVFPTGADLLEEALRIIPDKNFNYLKQNDDDATFCKKIDKETAHINWNESAEKVHNLIRGLNQKPGAWTTYKDKNLKIWKSAFFTDSIEENLSPGQVFKLGKKRLLIGTGDSPLEILNLQPETKKSMDALSFLNGHRISNIEKTFAT